MAFDYPSDYPFDYSFDYPSDYSFDYLFDYPFDNLFDYLFGIFKLFQYTESLTVFQNWTDIHVLDNYWIIHG